MAETGMKQVWSGGLTRLDLTDLEGVGAHRFEGGNVYKYVKFNDGAANEVGVAGEVCYYHTLDGYKTFTVTSDISDTIEIGAGVLQAALDDGNFGWIQIKGAALLTIALTAGTDGDPLTPTGTTNGSLDLSAAVTDHVCAFAGDISDKEIICDFPW